MDAAAESVAPPPIARALIVEDLPASADWLSAAVGEAFPDAAVDVVGSVAAGRAFLDGCDPQSAPDLALVDLGLPDGSGNELIRRLVHDHPHCLCIVSTIYADDRHLFPALRAGARGYLLKDQPRDRMVNALRGTVGGEPPLSPRIAQRLLRVFAEQNAGDSGGREHKLSPRETETLTLIAKGYKLPQVADTLGVTRNTAAGYVKDVYRKLKISSRAEAALEASRLGLVGPL